MFLHRVVSMAMVTKENPFDIDTAIGLCKAGQTIQLAGGVYNRTSRIDISIGDDGTAEKPKTIRADENDRAIIEPRCYLCRFLYRR